MARSIRKQCRWWWAPSTLLGVLSFARFWRWWFGEFPRLVGRYCSYLLPKQSGGTTQILIFKTLRMTGHLRVFVTWNFYQCNQCDQKKENCFIWGTFSRRVLWDRQTHPRFPVTPRWGGASGSDSCGRRSDSRSPWALFRSTGNGGGAAKIRSFSCSSDVNFIILFTYLNIALRGFVNLRNPAFVSSSSQINYTVRRPLICDIL